MHKPKPWKCSICGQEVPDLPIEVLRHQLSHVGRRPYARDRPKRAEPDRLPARDADLVQGIRLGPLLTAPRNVSSER